MSIMNLIVKSGATLAPTGGTDLTFAPDGQNVQNGVSIIVPGDPLYATRRRAAFKYVAPPLNPSTGTYKRDYKSISYTLPLVLADGRTVMNTIRAIREVHPELPASNCLDLNVVMAQMLFDSDTTNFWAYGALN